MKHACKMMLTLLMFITLVFSGYAQTKTIKGKVIDDTKQGLPGVNVSIKGTTVGTITDIDGNYTIQTQPKSTLVFSYIGLLPQEVKVSNQSVINITLQENTQLLDEVVVTVGYGTVRKKDLTGSVSQLKPKENEALLFTSVDNMLSGKIAGLSAIGSGGTPGGAVSVQIRGANSLRGDNQPLYVIDNIPQASTLEGSGNSIGDFQAAQNPLTSLNPQDIESVDVLKDASATAIYGARGANGVILITTKKGSKGKTQVNVSANLSIANATRLPEMLGLRDYANFKNEIITGFEPEGAKNKVQYYFEGDEVRYIDSNGTYEPGNPDSYRVLKEINWLNEAFRQAFSQNYNVSVNGGGEKTTYYFSGGFKNIEGLVKKTGLKQGDLRLNLNSNINKNLKLTLNLNGSIKQNDMMSGGDTKGGASGSILRASIDGAPHELIITEETLPENRSTALSWIDDYDDETLNSTFRASIGLNWKISNIFSYELRAGGNMRFEERNRWFGIQTFRGMNDTGVLSNSLVNSQNYSIENLLNFNHKFNNIFSLSGVLGVNYEQYIFNNKITMGKDFTNLALRTDGMIFAKNVTITKPTQRDNQLASYLGRVNLSFFNGRYLATASLRADGSSKFLNNKWGYFPSASIAWRLEEEEFMKSLEAISQMKVRFGWGVTGNQGIDPYRTLTGYSRILDYANMSAERLLALGIETLPNVDLKWETTESYNIGLDFGFFNQRLSGSVDFYQKKTRDLLIDSPLPPSSAFSVMAINRGTINNKGFEASLTGTIIDKKKYSWNISGNIGINRSVIESLGLPETNFGNHKLIGYLGRSIGDSYGPVNIFAEGHAPGIFWGYQTDGIIQTAEEVKDMTYAVEKKTPGSYKIKDQNGDKVIDSKDMTFIGDPSPKFNYGIQSEAKIQDFSVSVSFIGSYGSQVYNSNKRYSQSPSKGASNIEKFIYENRWQGAGTSNTITGVTSDRANVSLDAYVEDASFFRLSDLTVAYNVPSKFSRKIGISRANVFVSGKNLLLFTDYTGFNPEVNSFPGNGLIMGVDFNSFPNPREFMLGINLVF